jgi:hypothetical protein
MRIWILFFQKRLVISRMEYGSVAYIVLIWILKNWRMKMRSEEQWILVGYCIHCRVALFRLGSEGLLSPGLGGDPDCLHELQEYQANGQSDNIEE